jgi:hypothetical protein
MQREKASLRLDVNCGREKERKKQKLVHDDPKLFAVIPQKELNMNTLTLMDTVEKKKIEVAW